jgi:hypothetical protein
MKLFFQNLNNHTMPTISFNDVNTQHAKYESNPNDLLKYALISEKELTLFMEKLKTNSEVTHVSVVMIETPDKMVGKGGDKYRTTVALFGANAEGKKISEIEGIYSNAPCPPKCKTDG